MTIEKIEGCVGCGTCVTTCPNDVLRQDSKTGKALIKYPEDCQLCNLCRMYCNEDAIVINPSKSIPVITSWG